MQKVIITDPFYTPQGEQQKGFSAHDFVRAVTLELSQWDVPPTQAATWAFWFYKRIRRHVASYPAINSWCVAEYGMHQDFVFGCGDDWVFYDLIIDVAESM